MRTFTLHREVNFDKQMQFINKYGVIIPQWPGGRVGFYLHGRRPGAGRRTGFTKPLTIGRKIDPVRPIKPGDGSLPYSRGRLIRYHACRRWINNATYHVPMNQVFGMIDRKVWGKMKAGTTMIEIIPNLQQGWIGMITRQHWIYIGFYLVVISG